VALGEGGIRLHTLQGFHDAFIKLGPLPMPLIRRAMLGEIGFLHPQLGDDPARNRFVSGGLLTALRGEIPTTGK
jgi:hypothetical protein